MVDPHRNADRLATVDRRTPLIVGSLAFEVPDWQPASSAAWAGVIYNVFAVISLGTYLWVRAVRLLPAGVSALGTLMIR